MYICFLTSKQLFCRFEKYISRFYKDINLTKEIMVNTKLLVVDLNYFKDIESINKIASQNLLPTIFINSKKAYSVFYNDSFLFSTVFSCDTDIYTILKAVKVHIDFYNKTKNDAKFVEFMVKNKRVIINSEDVLYIKADRNKSYVKTKDGEFYCKNIKICECKEVLGEDFCVCHKSYIVNKNNICRINLTKGVIKLVNKEEISIGRLYKQNFLAEILL